MENIHFFIILILILLFFYLIYFFLKGKSIKTEQQKENPEFTSLDTILNENRIEAFEKAIQLRNFELELSWKRANYFWVTIAAIFTGYILLITKDSSVNQTLLLLLKSTIIFLGFTFSLSWYFVNRGSRYWYLVWHLISEKLQRRDTGFIFNSRPSLRESDLLFDYGKYSVSRINIFISFIVTLVWFFLFLATHLESVYSYLNKNNACLYDIDKEKFIIFLLFINAIAWVCIILKRLRTDE